MKKILLFLFVYISVNLYSQNISGYWSGLLYQPNNTEYPTYLIYFNIEQKGENITGASKITFPNDTEIFGLMSIEGTFKNNVLYFKETKILSEDRKGLSFAWCFKTGNLKYSETKDSAILSGRWTGKVNEDICSPGTIILRKKIDKANMARLNKKPLFKNKELKGSKEKHF